MSLKDRIKELANARGMSLPTLETELGFGNSTIVKWDKSTPNVEKLNKVAKYFDVSLDYLVDGTDYVANESENVARNEYEREMLMLCRKASEATKEDKEHIMQNFESTIDLYLKAKGIKKE